ncbi:uncharacterized protein LOC130737797 isoform X1 [Lotus japonicus]|uniref:uncharacterized protein LOC130737797 isoform X1 n=1 Tax=Lotus japonicus TaxID=34305 RepID=UPI00258DD059|nr:uncharacterized protein LOC130737797 isoform X1 [Lotus japonicus]
MAERWSGLVRLMPLNPLRSICIGIDPKKDTWRVKVRVLRVWDMFPVGEPSKPYAIHVVLIDVEGVKIEGIIKKGMLKKFRGELVEGSVYRITYFNVISNSGAFRATEHGFKIVFNSQTKVRIISMWNTRARYLPTVQSCTEVILLDKEGSKIQASVCKDHRLRGEIFTGFVYKISKFKVIPNTRELRCTSHGYRLVFNTHTILTLSGDTSIPREGWSFYDTGYIERCRGIFSHLSDFIGVVSSVSAVWRFVTEGKTTKMMIVELGDYVYFHTLIFISICWSFSFLNFVLLFYIV